MLRKSLDPHRKLSISSENESDLPQSMATVTFKCEYQTIFGQELHIAGNIEELGKWDPSKSIKMETDETSYPIWTSSLEVTCPVGMTIEYKYIIINNGGYEWEAIPGIHRTITIKKKGEYVILNRKGDLSFKVKKNDNPYEDDDGLRYNNKNAKEGEVDMEKISDFLKLKKLSFDSTSSAIVSSMTPIDLLSYENNKRTCEFTNESLDFLISSKGSFSENMIMATEFLPVIIKKIDGKFKIETDEESAIFSTLNHIHQQRKANLLWVGMLRNYFDYTIEEIDEIDFILRESNYFMIFPEKEDWDDYISYTHNILFPIITDCLFDPSNEYLNEYDKYFSAYHRVNKKYAEIICEVTQEKDLIILNDINLALVPNTILQKNNNATIGIYIHSCLPSSDVVKLIPKYREIFKSILLCDVIGFHLYPTARNFMTILKRYFGLFFEITKQGLIVLTYFGRHILIHIKQGQIDIDYMNRLKEDAQFKQAETDYSTKLKDKFTIICLDHLTLFPSIAMKLRAFERFLDSHPELVNKVSLFFLIKYFESDSLIKSKQDEIEKNITRLRNKFNNESITYCEYTPRFGLYQRLSLFKVSNVFLYPLFFDGHCIYANEFVSMQEESKPYFLLLGENVTSNIGIKSAIRLNPYNTQIIAKVLYDCYVKTVKTKWDRRIFQVDSVCLKSNTTMKWVKDFLNDIKKVKFHDSTNKVGMGMGLNFKIMKLNDKFSHLSSKYLLKYYARTKKRLFFLDYESTLIDIDESLTEFTDVSESPNRHNAMAPNHRLLKILKHLTKDPNNLVFIMSKYETDFISKFFKPLPTLGLCGENGFFYKYPHDDSYSQIANISDWSWKETVLKMLKVFTEKTEGSYIVENNSCISWNYKHCDSYFGHIQANEIKTHISSIFGNKIEIVTGEGCVEIKPKDVNKAAFVAKVLQNEFKKEKIDFIFVVGDDNTDEEIFKYLKSAEKYFTNFGKRVKTITTVIGKKPSEAKYYFNEVNDCIETLELLIRYNVSDKKENLSTRDLPNFMEGNHLVQPANKRLSMTMNSKLLLPLKQMNE